MYDVMFSYAQYFASKGDRVVVMERMPTNTEISKFKPDCIISAEKANIEINRYIYIWNIPWTVISFAPDQYVVNDDEKYPSLVIHANEETQEKVPSQVRSLIKALLKK